MFLQYFYGSFASIVSIIVLSPRQRMHADPDMSVKEKGMKTKIALVFVLFVSIPLARSAPIEGAATQGWYYDAENHVVSLRIVNTSDVPITAFVLAVAVTDSNGPSEGGLIRDFLNHAVFVERYKGTGEASKRGGLESIPARGTSDEKVGVPADFRDFVATLTVVAFADKTASGVSPEEHAAVSL